MVDLFNIAFSNLIVATDKEISAKRLLYKVAMIVHDRLFFKLCSLKVVTLEGAAS